MKSMLAGGLVLFLFAAKSGVATAQEAGEAPDLKGRWVGMSEAIVLGKAPHHVDASALPEKPRTSRVEFTFTINGQEGHRLWGTIESPQDQETFIASFALMERRS